MKDSCVSSCSSGVPKSNLVTAMSRAQQLVLFQKFHLEHLLLHWARGAVLNHLRNCMVFLSSPLLSSPPNTTADSDPKPCCCGPLKTLSEQAFAELFDCCPWNWLIASASQLKSICQICWSKSWKLARRLRRLSLQNWITFPPGQT